MDLTRRQLLEMAAVFAVAPPQDDVARRAADIIRAYSAEGSHRTATIVDRASADALLARARATGASALLQPFELSRVDTAAAFIQIEDHRIEGLPMFDGAFTAAGGIRGTLGAVGGDRPIGWTRVAPNAEAAFRTLRDGSTHAAIVAVTMGGKPGLCPVNAGWFRSPFGPPVLQVSSDALPALESASASAAEVRVVAHVTREPAQAFNVVADIRGADPALAPVCVMTPRSGWHANASERGGGIVCWLETMRAVMALRGPAEAGHHRSSARTSVVSGSSRTLRTVKFVASSGHELGHLGLHDYLRRNPALARGAFAWVHFGANIGASTGEVRLTPSDEALRDAAVQALRPHALDHIRQTPVAQVSGEAATIKDEGGRFVSLIGANAWFHNPRDVWPDAVDVDAVARFARATAGLTRSLANAPA